MPRRSPSDEELVLAIPRDPAAFSEFYRRHVRAVLGFLARRCGDPEQAADLTAEVFAAVLLQAPRFRPGRGDARGWLFAIARHKQLDAARRGTVEARARRRLGVRQVQTFADDVHAIAALGSEVEAWLEELPPDQRDAITGRVLHDRSYDDLAARSGVSAIAMRQRVARARDAARADGSTMSDFVRRLEDELVRAGYDRRLRARLRRSPARPLLVAACALVLAGAVALAGSAVLGGDAQPPAQRRTVPAPPAGIAARVGPRAGGRHQAFTVSIVTTRATGVAGQIRRGYSAEAHAVRPAVACVNNRDRVFRPARPGARVRAVLDPARGEGGPEGWCRGLFRGTVRFTEAFACPAQGVCRPPAGFPSREVVVARFSFTVR